MQQSTKYIINENHIIRKGLTRKRGEKMHMKKLNGSLGESLSCFIDICDPDECTIENCWIYDSCRFDYAPPCTFVDICFYDY